MMPAADCSACGGLREPSSFDLEIAVVWTKGLPECTTERVEL
jgi:hypothetical protein